MSNDDRKKTAVVLGGTAPHKELIRKLKGRGYYVVLIDYRDNPPAACDADIHLQESTFDEEAVIRICREYEADICICTCVDQAYVIACRVSEKLGLPHPYSSETATLIANKISMKKFLTAHAIPTARHAVMEEGAIPDISSLRFPLIVKPSDSYSSNKVRRVGNPLELGESIEAAINYSRCKKAIVEEYIDGREISAYFRITEGLAECLMITEKVNWQDKYTGVIKNHTAFTCLDESSVIQNGINEIGQQIGDVFGLNNTFMFFQGIITGKEVYVIEFAPRLGGGASFESLKLFTGIDVTELSIDYWLSNRKINYKKNEIRKGLCIIHIYGKNGVYDHTIGIESLERMAEIKAIYFDRAKGETIDSSRQSSSRVLFIVFETESREAAKKTIDRIYESIDIIDIDGNSILDRDIRYK